MFKKLSDNLNILMAKARISASQLAKNTGLPSTTIKRIRNDPVANPTLISLLPIAKFFRISVSQLIGDEELPNQLDGRVIVNKDYWSRVPICTWEEIAAGINSSNIDAISYTVTDKKISDGGFALAVKEENWENLLPGTLLIVDPLIKPEHRDYSIVLKEGQKKATMNQILIEQGEIYLKPMVSGYKILPFSDQYKLLGVLIEYKMDLRKPNL